MPVEEDVRARRDADTALGTRRAQPAFQQVRIGGMNLQSHGAGTAVTPAARRDHPAEIEDPHPRPAVAAHTLRVLRPLGGE